MSKTVKLFLSMGLVATLSACGGERSRDATSPTSTPETEASQTLSEGGEGEEYSAGEKANAEFKDILSGAELLSDLKKGGYIIYFRHAQTTEDYADQADPNLDLENCETQRKLSDVGEKQAKDIGAAFTAKSIPVGDVITSDYCRAWKTADLAFGQYQKNSKLNFLPFEDYTDTQVEEMKNNVMPLLTAVPISGNNTVIVGHDDIFEAATGIYPDPQGMAYVLKPDGKGGFKIVANLLPDEWMKL
ncbi:MAG: histidine phosphatase family protein [Chloroflexaceae bacterium]|nr:histidine phosphatase family protein [Chloroflexaceae bacterium]